MKIGRIYKIISGQSNECYVGSTFDQLNNRFKGHKNGYKNKDNPRASHVSSFDLFDKYGVENCKMILIKEYAVLDRRHLETKELLWIKKLGAINKIEPVAGLLSKIKAKKSESQMRREEQRAVKEEEKEMMKSIREENKKMREQKKRMKEEERRIHKESLKLFQKKEKKGEIC